MELWRERVYSSARHTSRSLEHLRPEALRRAETIHDIRGIPGSVFQVRPQPLAWTVTFSAGKDLISVMTSKELSYLGIGIGLGTAAAMLLAPRSGEETQQLLKDKANDAKRRAEELRDSAAQVIDRGKGKLRQQVQNLSAAVEGGKQTYGNRLKLRLSEKKAQVLGASQRSVADGGYLLAWTFAAVVNEISIVNVGH
jgi:gas vesicle protein